MLKYKIFLILCIFSTLQAESPYSFLRYNAGARAAALGGTAVCLKDDPSAVFYNPALISTVEKDNLNFTFLKHVLDMNSGNVTYIYDKLEDGKLAANIAYTNYGSFDYRNTAGIPSGQSFSGSNMSLGVTYSNELDSNFYYGVTGKFIYVGLEQVSSSALALDAGLFYKLKDGRTNIGASILNAGFQLSKFAQFADKLPLDVRVGINHRLRGLPLLINFNFHHLADSTENFFDKFKSFSLGGEFYFGKNLQLRVGYDNQIRSLVSNEAAKGLSGLSFGAGFIAKEVKVDYSFSQYGSAATLHRFSLGLSL